MRAAAALVLLMCAPGLGGCWFGAHLHLGGLALAWHQGAHHVMDGFTHVVIRLH